MPNDKRVDLRYRLPEPAKNRIARQLSSFFTSYVKGAIAQALLGWVSEKQGRRIVLEHDADGVEVTFSQDGEIVENPFVPGEGRTTIIP
jgi:hypothetical protein